MRRTSPAPRGVAWRSACGLALALLLGAATLLGQATRPTWPVFTPQQRVRLAALRTAVFGTDGAASLKALEEVQALGEPARAELTGMVRELLKRDRSQLERLAGGLGDPAKLQPQIDAVTTLRQEALANIAKLEKGEPVRKAHEYYEKLGQAQPWLNQVFARRDTLAQALQRRPVLLEMWKGLAPADDDTAPTEKEAKLAAAAERGLGLTAAELAALPPVAVGPPPKEPVAFLLWHHRSCVAIDAYNRKQEAHFGAQELANAQLVNAYRQMLGLLPLELDARLVQSARRHSKEMVDLKYFSHDSPTASEKSFADRERNAGYGSPSGENIAMGVGSGQKAFWMWFDSPGHHKNMASAGSTALGVGKWGAHWTQNMGSGKRLMLLDEAERKKVAVKGEILRPRGQD